MYLDASHNINHMYRDRVVLPLSEMTKKKHIVKKYSIVDEVIPWLCSNHTPQLPWLLHKHIFTEKRDVMYMLLPPCFSVSLRFLSQLLGNVEIMDHLHGNLENCDSFLIRAWFRCCLLVPPRNELLDNITRYDVILFLTV